MKKIAGWTFATLIILTALVVNLINYYSGYSDPSISVREIFISGMSLLFVCFILLLGVQIFIIWIFTDQVVKLKTVIEQISTELNEIKKQNKKIQEDVNILI